MNSDAICGHIIRFLFHGGGIGLLGVQDAKDAAGSEADDDSHQFERCQDAD